MFSDKTSTNKKSPCSKLQRDLSFLLMGLTIIWNIAILFKTYLDPLILNSYIFYKNSSKLEKHAHFVYEFNSCFYFCKFKRNIVKYTIVYLEQLARYSIRNLISRISIVSFNSHFTKILGLDYLSA